MWLHKTKFYTRIICQFQKGLFVTAQVVLWNQTALCIRHLFWANPRTTGDSCATERADSAQYYTLEYFHSYILLFLPRLRGICITLCPPAGVMKAAGITPYACRGKCHLPVNHRDQRSRQSAAAVGSTSGRHRGTLRTCVGSHQDVIYQLRATDPVEWSQSCHLIFPVSV